MRLRWMYNALVIRHVHELDHQLVSLRISGKPEAMSLVLMRWSVPSKVVCPMWGPSLNGRGVDPGRDGLDHSEWARPWMGQTTLSGDPQRSAP